VLSMIAITPEYPHLGAEGPRRSPSSPPRRIALEPQLQLGSRDQLQPADLDRSKLGRHVCPERFVAEAKHLCGLALADGQPRRPGVFLQHCLRALLAPSVSALAPLLRNLGVLAAPIRGNYRLSVSRNYGLPQRSRRGLSHPQPRRGSYRKPPRQTRKWKRSGRRHRCPAVPSGQGPPISVVIWAGDAPSHRPRISLERSPIVPFSRGFL
jgi:hypothetical protein